MADRTVKVSLILQATGYMSGMQQAAAKTRETGSEIEKLAEKRQAFTVIGSAALAAGAAIGVGIGMAVSRFAEFDQQMSYVQAATHETAANMDLLRDAALDAGARTVFSATEAAAAIEELSKAGVSTADILSGGLDAALDLAAAGGLGVADAAGIAAVALKTFNLQGRDMTHVADLLAAGAGKAMGDVADLSAALAQGGQVAKQTGLTIEETTAGLSAFAAQGLLGSDAGTSFKSMLQRLTPQSAEARDRMRELGISAYDANGEFIGLAQFAGNLQQALEDLTPEQRNSALATIFGSDAVRAATVLYSEGESGIRDWISAVDDQGYAAETAAIRLDNLRGDWEALTGAIDTAMISTGEAANGPLRFGVQVLTEMVDAFNDLPSGGQQAVFWIGAVGAAVALAGGSFLVAVPKVAEYRAAIDSLGPAAQRTSRLVGSAFKALGLAAAVGAGLTILDQWLDTLGATDEQLRNVALTAGTAGAALSRIGTADGMSLKWWGEVRTDIDSVRQALDATADASESFWGWMSYGTANNPTIDVLKQYGEALGTLAQSDLPAAQAGFRQLVEEYGLSGRQQMELLEQMPALKDALIGVAGASVDASDQQSLLAFALGDAQAESEQNEEALADLAGQAQSTNVNIGELADTIRGFGSASLDTRAAARDFEAALDDLTASIAENGTTLDRGTEQGRANEAALDALATSSLELAAATITQTGNQADANRVIADGRTRLIEMLAQFGITGQAAEDYANDLGLIPGSVSTAVDLYTDEATRRLNSWLEQNSKKKVTIAVGLGGSGGLVVGNYAGGFYERAKPKEFYSGGFPSGIYPGTESGIHKFAEKRLPWETYISPDPAYRRENLAIWGETGRRLGAWEPAPMQYASAPSSASLPPIEIVHHGDNYAFDPRDQAREQREQMTRVLAAYGI